VDQAQLTVVVAHVDFDPAVARGALEVSEGVDAVFDKEHGNWQLVIGNW
jgi:hypothetical protein